MRKNLCRAVLILFPLLTISIRADYVDDFKTEARFARALVEKQLFDFAGSQIKLIEANFDENGDELNILKADYYAGMGQRSKAAGFLLKIKKESPNWRSACLARANIASKPADIAKGYEDYRATVTPPIKDKREQKVFTDAMFRYADVLRKLGNTERAAKIIEAIPEYVKDKNGKAEIDTRMIKLIALQTKLTAAQTKADREKPKASYASDVQAVLKPLRDLQWGAMGSDLATALAYTETAHAHILLGDADAAIEALGSGFELCTAVEKILVRNDRKSIAASPVPSCYYYLGEAYKMKGNTAREAGTAVDAQRFLLKALKQYHKVVKKKYRRSPVFDRCNNEVITIKDILIKEYGINAEALHRMFAARKGQDDLIKKGHVQYRLENFDKALPLYLDAARFKLKGRLAPDALLYAAICAYKSDRLLEAIAIADFMSERHPKSKKTHDALFNVATICRVHARKVKKTNPELGHRLTGYAAYLMGRFVKRAPDHPNAAAAAWAMAETQFSRGQELTKKKKELIKAGAPKSEVNAMILKIRAKYLRAVPLYEVLTKHYGPSQEGIKARHRLGWIYHIADDNDNAVKYFLEYCDVQRDPIGAKYESKFLAARRLMMASRVEEAILQFTEFLEWTKSGGAYKKSKRLDTFRQNAYSFLAWCYDKQANIIKKEIAELDKLAPVEKKTPVDDQDAEPEGSDEDNAPEDGADVDDSAVADTEDEDEELIAEEDDYGAGDLAEATDTPAPLQLTADEITKRKARLDKQFTKLKDKAIAKFRDIIERYPESQQRPANMAKIGTLFAERGEFHTAAKWLKRLKEEHGDSNAAKQAMFTLGRTYIEIGNYPEATTAFRAMLEKLPDYPLANVAFVGSNLYIDDDPKRPGLDADIVLAANQEMVRRADDTAHPDNARARKRRDRALFRIAACKLATKDYSGALAVYEQMLKDNNTQIAKDGRGSAFYWDILLGHGKALRADGQIKESIDSFDRLMSEINRNKHPGKYFAALCESGVSMAMIDDGDTVRRSIARFMQVIEWAKADDPDQQQWIEKAYLESARVFSMLGETKRALEQQGEYQKHYAKGKYRKEIMTLPPKRF
jgi:tetratricopeptide (TPR) repeat protein